LCALGGEKFGRKAYAMEGLEKKHGDEEQSGKELVHYFGYLGHEEDVIVTVMIEVAEEVLAKFVKKKVNSDSNIKEFDEEGSGHLPQKSWESVMTLCKVDFLNSIPTAMSLEQCSSP